MRTNYRFNGYWMALCAILLACACQKEVATPFTSTGFLDYSIDETSPSAAKVKEWKAKYDVLLLYKDLHERDFVWDFETKQVFGMVTTDVSEDVLPAAISFFESQVFPYYTDSFLKAHFPLRLALADSCYMFMDQFNIKVPYAFVQTNGTLLMGNVNAAFAARDAASLKQLARTFNDEFFKYLFRRAQADVPEFFSLVDYAHSNTAGATEPKPQEMGFWAYRSVRFAPTAGEDFVRWMKELATTPAEAMDGRFYYTRQTASGEEVAYSRLMRRRYDVLLDYLDKQGLDVQALRGLYE